MLIQNKLLSSFGQKLKLIVEKLLTKRKIRIYKRKEKSKKKNVILDWLEAFLWAAVFVLILNQYLFQAYRIPTGSMIPTLLVGDNIFVNKFVYGPELLPGIAKISGFWEPERGDLIVFENPEYEGQGLVYTLLKRLVYMLSLSIIDIDRIRTGSPVPDLFIKRALALSGDRVRHEGGQTLVLPEGGSTWLDPLSLQSNFSLSNPVRRVVNQDHYEGLAELLRIEAWRRGGLLAESEYSERRIQLAPLLQSERDESGTLLSTYDRLEAEKYFVQTSLSLDMANRELWEDYAKIHKGWFIPESRIMPIGDNRDDSHDGRFFGPVLKENVLGKAAFRFWPFNRLGSVDWQ